MQVVRQLAKFAARLKFEPGNAINHDLIIAPKQKSSVVTMLLKLALPPRARRLTARRQAW
jgi:hypothetical protein